MSLAKTLIQDGSMTRPIQGGDVAAAGEAIPATNAGNAVTITGALLAAGFFLGSEGANATYTLDSAANVIAALTTGPGNFPIQNGTTFRYRHINNAAFTGTYAVTANTGWTLGLNTAIAASSVKEYLITIINGTPATAVAGLTTNASPTVSGFTPAMLAGVTVGMIVTNAVNGLQGTTVQSINLGAGTITFSGNANATSATVVAIQLSPVMRIDSIGQMLL